MFAESNVAPLSREDVEFNLFQVLKSEHLLQRPEFAHHDQATFNAVLEAAEGLSIEKFQNHYRKSDTFEPTFDGERVTTLAETREAIMSFVEAGFLTAGLDEESGGIRLPFSILQACYAFFQAGNISTTAYLFLTASGSNVIGRFGTRWQKETFMKPMLEGRFLGTMCLSEPQAGSGLADIRTRAVREPDGSYLIRGTKMWISAGEHEMSENIVHLVLARVEGAPKGTRGISLFIVPKYRVNDDGSLGARNDVLLAGLNHKMGWRGITNTVLNFGDNGECQGFLVGEENRGLEYMFVMMNEARISVGTGATVLGVAGYRYSSAYSKTRLQGRLAGQKDPGLPQVPIHLHADVRRMLLTQKAYAEGALALCLYTARLVDDVATDPDPEARERAHLMLELLTPVVKAWPSQFCLEANNLAIQVLGGYGYTRDYPVEQYYRDNRLNPIHEGTNGIMALDLLGRKVGMKAGAAIDDFGERVRADIGVAPQSIQAYANKLGVKLDRLIDMTRSLISDGRSAEYLANASYYANAFGHLTIGWMWLRQASAAENLLIRGEGEGAFLRSKVTAMKFFFDTELDLVENWLSIVPRVQEALLSDVDIV
ncbi:acyl-CoA dehydrogenase [Aquamicrobium defluvii]|uniref:Acyl-CoA dehydrogenase n=1 Tax=Aquamicrobium defluvii TaxID=69279 RepID=A0A011THZ8_9HYPH|nr:acyl-CoA dehydrogenase [Aquamicrobium defluvii]EXL03607.1 acyl-CoA dehydrogenase [Aquamicrobium defluvii]EZQ15282.1 acyl-CoA dehydrogenase [Halopseudomonas bauzanensis]TDR32110.1 butyryl-CoA dehydrogenase [Aquamicrobium defluvii]